VNIPLSSLVYTQCRGWGGGLIILTLWSLMAIIAVVPHS
jgi:hypothetical protein